MMVFPCRHSLDAAGASTEDDSTAPIWVTRTGSEGCVASREFGAVETLAV